MSCLGRVKLAQFKPRKDFVHQVLPLSAGRVRLIPRGPDGAKAVVDELQRGIGHTVLGSDLGLRCTTEGQGVMRVPPEADRSDSAQAVHREGAAAGWGR